MIFCNKVIFSHHSYTKTMKDYVVAIGIIYILIITFILGKMLLEKKDGMKNKKIKHVKRKTTPIITETNYEADDINSDAITPDSADDIMFNRIAMANSPNRNAPTSGKNLQYEMFKDGFQLSSQAGHLDSMMGISMSDFGA